MLDFIYYPVSAVLALWHTVFGLLLGPTSGLGWVLAVIFLVLTFRAALFLPFLKVARTQAIMKRLRPEMIRIKQRHRGDRLRQSEELQRLYRDNGLSAVTSLLGVATTIAQLLLFIGLFHVLASFDRTGSDTHLPFLTTVRLTHEQNLATPNYLFDADAVRSFLDAKLAGIQLSTSLCAAGDLMSAAALLVIPLVLITAVATHFTARASLARHESPAVLRTLMLWVLPCGALISGAVMPVAILFYFVTNNACTLAQQHLVYRRLDAEQPAAKASAPSPGAKPKR
ncbi:membrane protein insertase YidC [Nocardia panacis]|uniref:Membrane protein insertase YidC n=1 Tax=Nocardia panacis TaxID=2340916 RepID=A0A3A4K6B5_9NOCA|nr:membrane protein insertase YidC [Nocardia panacis]RJO68179.1 membrane protein insertase YidC [Nocardia panacis]